MPASFPEWHNASTQASATGLMAAPEVKVGPKPLILRPAANAGAGRSSGNNTPRGGSEKKSASLSRGLLGLLRERHEASKIREEWGRSETERAHRKNEFELLKTAAFQLRNFFLTVKAIGLREVVAKLVFNFEVLHNNYLCTSRPPPSLTQTRSSGSCAASTGSSPSSSRSSTCPATAARSCASTTPRSTPTASSTRSRRPFSLNPDPSFLPSFLFNLHPSASLPTLPPSLPFLNLIKRHPWRIWSSAASPSH